MAIFKMHSQAVKLLKNRPSIFLVYGWMASYIQESSAKVCSLSIEAIASECNLSRITTCKALSELVRLGILHHTKNPGYPSEYRLIEVGDWNRQPQKVDELLA